MTLPGFTSSLRKIRYTDCFRHIEHALGGPMSPDMNPKEIVDQAGEHLVSLNPWQWLGVRSCQLKLRAKIAITGATWTAATKTITKTGAFSAYDYVAGDAFEVTAGTNATTRRFLLSQTTAPTANAIVLTEDIGATDGAVDIAGTLLNNTVRLPEILRDARSISASDALVHGMNWVTTEELQRKRTAQVDVSSSWNFYGAITYAGSPPRPILEIWPEVTATNAKGLDMYYRVGWVPGTSDTDELPIPPFMHAVFFRLVRIFALGYEEGDESGMKSLDQALMEFQMSPLLREAMQRDGAVQPVYGPVRGGAAQRYPSNIRRLLASQVDAPS